MVLPLQSAHVVDHLAVKVRVVVDLLLRAGAEGSDIELRLTILILIALNIELHLDILILITMNIDLHLNEHKRTLTWRRGSCSSQCWGTLTSLWL